jgi:hypothetical protein
MDFFPQYSSFTSQLFDGHPLGTDSLGFSRNRLVLRLQNQLYRLSIVRNDLHVTEFFEPICTEFNTNS